MSRSEAGGGIIVVIVVVAIYFLPLLIALARNHHQMGAVFAINFFLGWTLVGWVVALAFALSATPAPATLKPTDAVVEKVTSDTRPCPHCAELIKKAAKVCRFCNRDVAPAS